jgi:hypothetical protein
MKKMIPYEKLQKKKQKEIAARQRGTWGDISPITKKISSAKIYNRKKAGRWNEKSYQDLPFNLHFQRVLIQ